MAFVLVSKWLTIQIADLKKELIISAQQPSNSENYEVMISDLTSQLQEMRLKVKDHENRTNQQVILGELQQQISDIKQQHSQNIVKGTPLSLIP